MSSIRNIFRRRRKRILLVSPKSPSGVTWLLNALICLGVRIDRNSSPDPGTFCRSEDGSYRLHSAETNLKLHLPELSATTSFDFSNHVVVEWTHDWPTDGKPADKTFVFVRDPRDALFSLFKRRNPTVSFEDFLVSFDHVTLLDQIDCWRLFIRSWMATNGAVALRFEEFKEHPEASLSRFFADINVKVPTRERVQYAIESSSVSNAKLAEEQYIARAGTYFPSGSPLNRKGMPFEWKHLLETNRSAYETIERRCRAELAALGYEPAGAAPAKIAVPGPVLQLPFYKSGPKAILNQVQSSPDEGKQRLILGYCADFVRDGGKRYGYYQPWELEQFDSTMKRFVEIALPEIWSANRMLPLTELTALAIDALISASNPTNRIV